MSYQDKVPGSYCWIRVRTKPTFTPYRGPRPPKVFSFVRAPSESAAQATSESACFHIDLESQKPILEYFEISEESFPDEDSALEWARHDGRCWLEEAKNHVLVGFSVGLEDGQS